MDATDSPAAEAHPSLLQGALGIFAAAMTFVLWWQSGRAADLLGGLGFLIIAPAWYAVPLNFSAPLRQALSVRNRVVPRWAAACAGIGALLIVVSAAARVWAGL